MAISLGRPASFGKPLTRSMASIANADILVLSPTPTAPTDQGNRKRIYAVCSELKRRGARIHFMYYPHEWWFNLAPMDTAVEMAQQWDSFFLLPSTRPLHRPAEGAHHKIDEWWDPVIGDYLKWIFERTKYDAFIVNYTFLSKAFEYAPASTLRILDTHDKFTGRRELLESNGVDREFFYTTEDQEAIALNRAHLVWAIKDEEAEFFKSISKTSCITMPHVEPVRSVGRRRAPVDEGYLVLGMLGANNAINISNAVGFVEKLLPRFRRRLAPIKIRFAGGMCRGLQGLANVPGVDIMGRVDSVDEFYESVDAVIVPLAFSTGLKIKAVEAFASGMPLVGLARALEGIPVEHPFHQCKSDKELADACLSLAYDRSLLENLAAATRATYEKVQSHAKEAFDFTSARIARRATIVVCVGPKFFDSDSPYQAHVKQTAEYLQHLGNVVLYFDQPLPAIQATMLEAFNGLGAFAKVALSPGAGQTKSPGLTWYTATLEEVLASSERTILWVLHLAAEVASIPKDLAARVLTFLRLDTLRIFQPESYSRLAEIATQFGNLQFVESGWSGRSDWIPAGCEASAPLLTVPFWRYKPWQINPTLKSNRVEILAHRGQLGLARSLARLLNRYDAPQACRVVGVLEKDDEHVSSQAGEQIATVTPETRMRSFQGFAALPRYAIDLSPVSLELNPYRETLCRAGVPIVSCMATSAAGPWSRGNTINELLSTVFDPGLKDDTELASRAGSSANQYNNDAGWTKVWRLISAVNAFSSKV